MSATSTPTFLHDLRSGTAAAAEVLDAISERHLLDWENLWMPELRAALTRLQDQSVARKHWPQSRDWDWRKKMSVLRGHLAFPGFAIVAEGATQGLMIVDVATKKCRLEAQKNKPLVYVMFLENAPWNRPQTTVTPRFRGVGTVLIREAIELSKKEEFKGRIGLHSLPQANGFYANKCGMTDLGVETADENHKDLRYFEMTEEQADAFVKKGGRT